MKSLYYIMLLLFLLVSCQTKEERDKEEENIIIALLPEIIDSTCMDLRIYKFRLPLPTSIYDKNNNFIRFDSTNLAKDSVIYKRKLDSLEKDTNALYLEFNPILKDVEERYKIELFSHFKIKEQKVRPNNKSLKIDHQNIKTKRKFKLQNTSSISKINTGEAIYSDYSSGLFSISRIYFDEQKKFGILTAGYYCGSRCGEGFTIFIKKMNEKWIIDQIQDTWIA
ncbi:hypothetical protein [Pedobacter agri]|uniref:hypothetical protein n=1 Tax=Pedobacter agri TaxID=454586 RepID=UPI002930777D|nr:hypothetical protein [Pedobacter agri]